MDNLATKSIEPARPVDAGKYSRPALCQILLDTGKLMQSDSLRALRLQEDQDRREKIGSILVKLGLVSEEDVVQSVARQLGIKIARKSDFPDPPITSDDVSLRFLQNYSAIILADDVVTMTIALADPLDSYVLEALRVCTDKNIVPYIGLTSELQAEHKALARESAAGDQDSALSEQSQAYSDDVEQLKELAGEAPVIKFVNQLLMQAAESGASDIHLQPFEGQLKVRLRIDGMLREIDVAEEFSLAAVISRVKIMANMNIAERRLAQDGRFRHRVRGVEYDLRVSTVPTLYGENVAIRLLRRDPVSKDFASLGFSDAQEKSIKQVLANPHGILLVTGPTGSGKSTTLYASLEHLNQPERMIITVEDPVEYNIRGINQMQVKPQIGLTFANALRSIVRQDPDIIMVGEMRDSETAKIAVQSALTGHLVLSTLHTNDAASSIMRLLDMGVEDYLLTSAIIGIQAQRLVRTLCAECRSPVMPDDETIRKLQLDRVAPGTPITLYSAAGCAACGGTGYAGRLAILEILLMTDRIKQLVLQRAEVNEIAQAAIEEGMVPMRDDGLMKAVAGLTTVEEVVRVTPEESWQ